MKLHAVAITGLFTLNIIGVAFTASVRSYATSGSEPIYWKEHVSEADKRSMECTECASMDHKAKVTAEKRAVECTGCANMDDNAAAQPVQELSPNPMNPYLSLKPFLPVKPTFVPPFLDPNYFISKKADLLNNLFGATNTESFDSKPSSAEAKRDSVGESASSVQPRLVPLSPFLALSPTVKPTIVPPGYWMPMSGPGIVDPATMIDKKTTFLNTLFSKIAAPDSSVAARAVAPEDLTSAASTAKQSAIPTDFWLQFLPPFTTPEPPTAKPTIVPPGFWIPSSISKVSAKPFSPKIPSVDPSEIIDKKTAFLNTLFKTLNITITPATETAEATPDPIPAYLQKVVSPTPKPTIVPPGYWMPMSGPGIVDPATMIDKKTTFLNTLFSKIAVPDSSVAARAVVSEGLTSAASTAKQSAIPTDFWLQFLPSLITPEPPTAKPTIVPPGFWMPSSIGKVSAKPLSPKIPSVDPSEFIDKKTSFLNTLFKTLNITITPTTETAEATPDPIPAYLQKVVSPTARSGPGIVDPATMIDKKTTFLNTLFSKIAAPDSSVAARAVVSEGLTSAASTAKQSAIPTDFWLQFLPSLITPEPPTAKPTIVPPGFWMPSSISKVSAKPFSPKIPIVDPSEFIDKKTAFLNTLFKTLNISITPTTETAEVTPDPIPAYLQKVVSPTAKPTIVPPEYWMPMSGPGIVDPATMIDKKTTFLNTLFSKIAVPDSSVAARAVVSEGLTSAASTAKQSAIPTDFWLQFLPSFTTAEPPAVTPTIVPPGFWVPSSISKAPAKPFSPKIPSVDPSEFIDKKTAFLNTLFKTLNTTITPSPSRTLQTTPDPIADFLYQLLSSAVNNSTPQNSLKRSMTETGENIKTDNSNSPSEEEGNEIPKVTRQPVSLFNKRSTITEDISVQSPMPLDALLDTKDKLINTIMGSLSGIKNNILETINELLAQQKEAAAISASTASKKKPGPPFGPWGAALLKTTPKPTLDPAPFQNKVEFLSQMFDTVTKLEKDVTDALNEAISESFSQSTPPTVTPVISMGQIPNATALLQMIKSKLSELANDSSDMQVPKFSRATLPKEFSTGLPTPMPTIVDPSFWIPKATPGIGVDPTFYLSKTQDFLSKLFASKAGGISADNNESTAYGKARSIKMAVHQGYQSLPPGTEELLQAGGGSSSMDHEGGGLKLQDDVFPLPVISNNREGHHHHHK